MSQSRALTATLPWNLRDARLFAVTGALVLGNLLLPMAVHRIPDGGRILLPIFFFTLVAGWRFGARAGILTGLLSPLASHLLTGMPQGAALQGILGQSVLLGVLASLGASWHRRAVPSLPSRRLGPSRLLLLGAVVLGHQGLILLPRLLQGGARPCLEALALRWPGLLLQVAGGFLVLRLLGRYLPGEGREG